MKIIHIHQMHKVSLVQTVHPEVYEQVVFSQFRVAQEIKRRPGLPVLVESHYNDSLDSARCPISTAARIIFPGGIPTAFSDLSDLQKQFLHEEGAAETLFYLGELPKIYKSIRKELSDHVDARVKNGEFSYVFAPREEEAIANCKRAALQHFGNLEQATVILVYGGLHDFNHLCQQEGIDLDEINKHLANEKIKPELVMDHKVRYLTAYDPKISLFKHKKEALEPIQVIDIKIFSDGLQTIMNDSDYVKNCVQLGYVAPERLDSIYQAAPWVVTALRYKNIYNSIADNTITIEELAKLDKEQMQRVLHLSGIKLRTQVLALTEQQQPVKHLILGMD